MCIRCVCVHIGVHRECTHCPLLTRVRCSPTVSNTHTHTVVTQASSSECWTEPSLCVCQSLVWETPPASRESPRLFQNPVLRSGVSLLFFLLPGDTAGKGGGRNQINHIHHLKLLLIYGAFVSTLFPHSWALNEIPGNWEQGRSGGSQAGKQNWEALTITFRLPYLQVLPSNICISFVLLLFNVNTTNKHQSEADQKQFLTFPPSIFTLNKLLDMSTSMTSGGESLQTKV